MKKVKGRGTHVNPSGRFETYTRQDFDDGWDSLLEESKVKTTVGEDRARSILTTNQSPDIPFDQSLNPYRGCEHGCIYCYARPSHAFLGLSPGLDFETKLFRKKDAAQLLAQTFRKPKYQPKTITIGSNTDPYQPIEREHQITRQVLEVMLAFKHPVVIITKSALILRDRDILAELAALGLVLVVVSVTSLDGKLANTLEPRASAPQRRIQTIQKLTEAGIPTGINAAPMIPALNDMELERILEEGSLAGARFASYIFIRLPGEVADLFRTWLETHVPDRASHVMSLIQQSREGQDYQSGFGTRMRGKGVYAQLLSDRFRLCCQRFALNKRFEPLRTDLFQPPPQAGDQLSLFDHL